MNEFDEFVALILRAKNLEHQSIGTEEFEAQFVEVIDFINAHPALRPKIVEEFAKLLQDRSYGPYTLIEFCMHELRWPEMLAEAKRVFIVFRDEVVRKKLHGMPSQHLSYLEDVISSFSDSWESKDLFKRYSEK
jgi:hypothetical protein